MPLDMEARKALEGITTATITTTLLKRGLRNVWMRNARPIHAGQGRVVGPAFTLRFVPGREDLATPESLSSATSTRGAIEAMPDGCIAVVDSCGIVDAGIMGDILCARMAQRGVAALVTDGAVRDLEGVKRTYLPIWCSGASAPPSYAHLTFIDWQQPIGCGGVAVFPDDILVADQDGAVVIPRAMVEAVITAGSEAEALEEWILGEVLAGSRLPGLYPPDAQSMARYREHRTGPLAQAVPTAR